MTAAQQNICNNEEVRNIQIKMLNFVAILMLFASLFSQIKYC